MGCYRNGRQTKLLQIGDAIRDYASQNGNRLPESLADIELHLPFDLCTNQPAKYELKNGVATLNWPLTPNLEEKRLVPKVYKIQMADTK